MKRRSQLADVVLAIVLGGLAAMFVLDALSDKRLQRAVCERCR